MSPSHHRPDAEPPPQRVAPITFPREEPVLTPPGEQEPQSVRRRVPGDVVRAAHGLGLAVGSVPAAASHCGKLVPVEIPQPTLRLGAAALVRGSIRRDSSCCG